MEPPEGEIAIRVERIEALFDSFDPTPMPDRDLAPRVDAHVVGWAEDLPRGAALRLRVILPPDQTARAEAGRIAEDIANHFAARAHAETRALSALRREGRIALAIGLAVLAVCILLGQALESAAADTPSGRGARLVAESLIIMGWVAMWRPAEIWLYEWWPILARRALFRRLAAAPVTVASIPSQALSGLGARGDGQQ